MRWIYLIFIIFLFSGCVPRFNAVVPGVDGQVIDAITGKAIEGAIVQKDIKSAQDGTFKIPVQTELGIATTMGGIYHMDKSLIYEVEKEGYDKQSLVCSCMSNSPVCYTTIKLLPYNASKYFINLDDIINEDKGNTSMFFRIKSIDKGIDKENPPSYDTIPDIDVDYQSGELRLAYNDAYKSFSNDTPAISLVRRYNSANDYKDGLLGYGWAFDFESKILKFSDEELEVFDATLMKRVIYKKFKTDRWKYVEPLHEKVITKVDDTYLMRRLGCSYNNVFNNSGLLISSKSENQLLTYKYNNLDEISSITNNYGSELKFKYTKNSILVEDITQTSHTKELYTLFSFNGNTLLVNVSDEIDTDMSYKYSIDFLLRNIKDVNNGNIKEIDYKDLKVSKISSPFFGYETYKYEQSENSFNFYRHKYKVDGDKIGSFVKYLYASVNGNKKFAEVDYLMEFDLNKNEQISSQNILKFDSLNRVVSNVRYMKSEIIDSKEYEYHKNKKVKTYRHKTQNYDNNVSFLYDRNSNIISITKSNNEVIRMNYNKNNQVSELVNNKYSLSFEYDQQLIDKPTTIRVEGVGAIHTIYDKDGEITSVKSVGEKGSKMKNSHKLALIVTETFAQLLENTTVEWALPDFLR